MDLISDELTDSIRHYLRRHGITSPALEDDLLDHICCAIENEMLSGADFDQAFRISVDSFGLLRAIQVETDKAILNRKRRADVLLSFANYAGTFIYMVLGAGFMVLPFLLGISQGIWFFLFFLPLAFCGYIVCFLGINYRSFELKSFGR